jgi:hypothetical protein
MPIKLTWKSILGVLAGLGAPVAIFTTHPTTAQGWVAGAVALGGWVVIGLERLADSKDFATLAGPGAVAEIAKVRAVAAADAVKLTNRITDLTAEATNWEALARKAMALTVVSVVPPVTVPPAPVPPVAPAVPGA